MSAAKEKQLIKGNYMNTRFKLLELSKITNTDDIESRKVVMFDTKLREVAWLGFQKHESTGWYGFAFNTGIDLTGPSREEQACIDFRNAFQRVSKKLASMGAYNACPREIIKNNFDYQIENEFLSVKKFLEEVRGY